MFRFLSFFFFLFACKIVSISRRKQFLRFVVVEWSNFSYQLLLDWQKNKLTMWRHVFQSPEERMLFIWHFLMKHMKYICWVLCRHFHLAELTFEKRSKWIWSYESFFSLNPWIGVKKNIVITSTNNNAEAAKSLKLKLTP